MSSDRPITSLVDRATSALLLDIDWDTTLLIVDLIRQGDITPKSAINPLLAKMNDPNPNVVLLALQVLESVVKNCGQVIHEYVATREFMEEMRDLLKRSSNEDVQKRILMLLAAWVRAFRSEPKYRAVQDTVNILKAEGFSIPTVVESDAMFTADTAPHWADGECCHRCRSQFTLLRRKHHCRACGQVFCADCSSKTSTIPKFGIEREVRVCEYCHDEINNAQHMSPKLKSETTSANSSSGTKANPNKKTAEELQEEEELQLALALSKSEAENKEKEKLRATSNLLGGGWRQQQSSPVPSSSPKLKTQAPERDDVDPELAKYLNRSYWEQQRQKQMTPNKKETSPSFTGLEADEINTNRILSQNVPSAPLNTVKLSSPTKINEALQNGGMEEVDDFVSTLRSQLEIFVNRMKSNQSRGRPIANDTAVQSLFMNITAMHAQLLTYIQEQDHKRVHCEQLQDKISQIRDARAALDALREEHKEKVRRDKEEQERIRQIQMMQKLEIMRKKKQEYLEYQRQLALHRMAESERQIFSSHSGSNVPGGHSGQPGYPPMAYPQQYPPQNPMGGYMYPAQGESLPHQGMIPPFQGPQPAPGHISQSGHAQLSGGFTGSVPGSHLPPPGNPEYGHGHFTVPAGPPNINNMANYPQQTNSITSPPGVQPVDQMIPQPNVSQVPQQQQEEQQTELISFD